MNGASTKWTLLGIAEDQLDSETRKQRNVRKVQRRILRFDEKPFLKVNSSEKAGQKISKKASVEDIIK